MIRQFITRTLLFSLFSTCACSYGALKFAPKKHHDQKKQQLFQTYIEGLNAHRFYLGFATGWGSTDWSHLVAKGDADEIDLLKPSAPLSAGDSGFAYGFTLGYEMQEDFALEFNYTGFPVTTIHFDPDNFYAGGKFVDNLTTMKSHTYSFNIVAKFMVNVLQTGIRGFANAGGAVVYRSDVLTSIGHICPTFGVGINYVFIQRLLLEFGFQYTAGYGKATLYPAVNYIPFLYSIMTKLAYRF